MSESGLQPKRAPRPAEPTRYARVGVSADALGAAETRVAFGEWLRGHFALSPERLGDIVLAVNEALANAAEYAYEDCPWHLAIPPGIDLHADYDSAAHTLAVAVADRGHWRAPAADPLEPTPLQSRGRGIPLMRALADEATIEATPTGTLVTLVWNDMSGSISR